MSCFQLLLSFKSYLHKCFHLWLFSLQFVKSPWITAQVFFSFYCLKKLNNLKLQVGCATNHHNGFILHTVWHCWCFWGFMACAHPIDYCSVFQLASPPVFSLLPSHPSHQRQQGKFIWPPQSFHVFLKELRCGSNLYIPLLFLCYSLPPMLFDYNFATLKRIRWQLHHFQ